MERRNKGEGLATILILLFGIVLPSQGSVVLYSNDAAWLATTQVSNTTGFEGIAPPGGVSDFLRPRASSPAGSTS